MRGLFLVLVLVNVAFFGWAHWIDVPPAAQAAESAPAAALPLLALAGSGPAAAAAATASGAAVSAGAPAPAPAPAQPGTSAADTAAAGGAAAGAVVPPSAAQAVAAGPGQGANAAGRARCRSLGPFTNAAAARTVADLLRARKLAPRSRTVDITLAGGTVSAYWLDVDLTAGESDPPLAALRRRAGDAADALRGAAFSDCPAAGAGG